MELVKIIVQVKTEWESLEQGQGAEMEICVVEVQIGRCNGHVVP